MSSQFLPTKLLAIAVLSSTAAFCQMAPTGDMAPHPQTSTRTADAPHVQPQAITTVDTMLKSGIDSAKAKKGDEITATVATDTMLPAGGSLPKGTTVVGHVTDVKAYDKSSGSPGSVSILFDQAKTKDGNTTAIVSEMKVLKPASNSYQASEKNVRESGAMGADGSTATSVPHVTLTPPADQSASSGTLMSANQNVRVDIGAKLTLALAAQGQ